jgi:DNA invertase Pin-like site-specific DNA recombinase
MNTKQEKTIIELADKGASFKQIAGMLNLSNTEVINILKNQYEKSTTTIWSVRQTAPNDQVSKSNTGKQNRRSNKTKANSDI